MPRRQAPFVDLTMFRSVPFTAMLVAGAISTFALFVPPYDLPLFAQSLGLSSTTGAGLVAAFNAFNAVGRFAGGPLWDKVGPTNVFVVRMILNAVSMLAIWPVSNTLRPLLAFAVLNGMANGAYLTVFPTVVASVFGPGEQLWRSVWQLLGDFGVPAGCACCRLRLASVGGFRESRWRERRCLSTSRLLRRRCSTGIE